LLRWKNDWAKFWMIYMLIGMWLSSPVVPFVAWDVFTELEFFGADLPGVRIRMMDGIIDSFADR